MLPFANLQDSQSGGSIKLPELQRAMEARTMEHGDTISQLIMECLLILLSPEASEMFDDLSDAGMEEGLGGSGPSSLGSLNLSFPQQMSLSSSTAGSSKQY